MPDERLEPQGFKDALDKLLEIEAADSLVSNAIKAHKLADALLTSAFGTVGYAEKPELGRLHFRSYDRFIPRETQQFSPQLHRTRAYIADVETSIERFRNQVVLCEQHALGFPCLEGPKGIPIPIDWFSVIGPNWEQREDLSSEQWQELLSERGFPHSPAAYKYGFYKPSEARALFTLHLTDFLTGRISEGGIDTPGGSRFQTGGLWFRVTTQTNGLRVHYSPSYFLNWSVFGWPTSPVENWIQPGRYKFGATGQGFPFRFDPDDFDVPRVMEAHLVNI